MKDMTEAASRKHCQHTSARTQHKAQWNMCNTKREQYQASQDRQTIIEAFTVENTEDVYNYAFHGNSLEVFKESNVTQEVINSAYNGSNMALKTPKTNETQDWENHNNMEHDSLDAEDN